MKKHFLLLLLMTLLPLAGWATVADLLVKPSLATGLIYNGGPQQLVVGGYNLPSDYDNAEGGVLWAVTTTDNAPTSGGALDATATDAGTYYVWYKVLADGGVYQDEGAWTKLTVGGSFCRISKASLGFEPATPAPGLVYDGTAQALFTANATAADFATIEYSIKTSSEPETWSEWTADVTAFTGTNAGSYTVKWRIANKAEIEANLTDNEDAYSGTFADVMIAGAEITAEIDGTPAFTFNGQVQTPTIIVKSGETTLTAGTDYEITYWTDETRNTTEVAAPTDAKTYFILVTGINNYRDNSVETLSYEIAKKSLADEDVTAVVKNDYINKTYKGKAIAGYVPANLSVKAYVGTDNELTLGSSGYDREGYENNINVPAADAADDQKPRFKVVGKGNFTGERYVYFNIVPRSLSTVTISADLEADQTYTGVQITPTTEGKLVYTNDTPTDFTLVENTDFTVAYSENKNVVKDGEGNVVNGGTITITGKGNYTDEVVKNFRITPVELTVNAKNFSKNLGSADPTSDELVAGNYYEITGYVLEETAETAGVTGAPTFAIAGHTETTGTKTGVISISAVTGLSAANYSFAAGAAADLIIGQASVTVAATATEETYGYKLPTLDKDAFGFTATGLNGAEEITGLTFTVTDANNVEVEYHAGDMLKAGEYTITPSAASATSDSYVFEYTPATLTINRYKLTIEAQDQAIDYGTEPVVCPTSWANTYVKFLDADGNTIGKTAFEARYGVWKEDFIENTEWEVADNHPLAEPGTIKVNLKEGYDDKNFEVETVEGHVTYNDLGGLVLTSTDDDLAAIEAANGTEVNVKIDFSLRNNRKLPATTTRYWKGGEWNTLTLPFDITVAELSQKLGYAIVNEIDPNGYSESSGAPVYKFKVAMKGAYGNAEKLPANKPFAIKTADDIKGVIDFGTQYIKAPTEEDLNGVVAGGGSKFKPAYAKKSVSSADNGKIWFLLGNHTKWAYITPSSSNTWTILPLESYIDQNLNPAENASNAIFMMEDLDGTTAIHGINVDDAENAKLDSAKGWYNLNGVKMENAPAMKGVYIKDGKKVVIK